MKKKIAELTDDELIRLEFNRRFAFQSLPMVALSIELNQATPSQRQDHYRKVYEIVSAPEFIREINDLKRRLMRQLALGVVTVAVGEARDMTELEKQGWRQTLIEIERWIEMLYERAGLKEQIKPLQSPAKNI